MNNGMTIIDVTEVQAKLKMFKDVTGKDDNAFRKWVGLNDDITLKHGIVFDVSDKNKTVLQRLNMLNGRHGPTLLRMAMAKGEL